MARKSVGKESVARTSTERARPETTSGELERGHEALTEVVQRLARDGHPGARGVRDAALALQRIAGNQSTARKLGATRSVRDVAHAGFQGASGQLPFMARIQESFGSHDIRGVRSFTGPGAAAASRALSAEAYASGDRVVFADAAPSLHTAAHEAAHVVQQRAGIQLSGGVGSVGDRHERHADAVASQVVRGESAQRSLDSYFSAAPRRAASPTRSATGVQRKFDEDLLADVDEKQDAEKNTDLRYGRLIPKLAEAIEEANKRSEKYDKGEELKINPDAVLLPMLYRLDQRDDVVYKTYEHLVEALKTRGAILINGEESGAYEAPKTDKFVITLLLPGSGDRRWRTFAENMLGKDVPTRTDLFNKMQEIDGDDKDTRKNLDVESGDYFYPTLFTDSGKLSKLGRGITLMIRGPGAFNTVSHHPSNNIANNVKVAKSVIERFLEDRYDQNVKLQIMGHSRNGVTAAVLTRDLRAKHPKLEIDSVIFDPVPGGDANLFNAHNDAQLSEAEDVNSTVVYSLMDDRPGFNPMRVAGAKRLILTHNSHHAGIESGFTYKDKRLKEDDAEPRARHIKGLGLLNLPRGLFIDERVMPGKPNYLKGPITDWVTIKAVITLASMEKGAKNKNRLNRIRQIVEAFLGTKPDNFDDEYL